MLAMMLSSTGMTLTTWQIAADVLFHSLALLPFAVAGWAWVQDFVPRSAQGAIGVDHPHLDAAGSAPVPGSAR